MNEQIIGDRYRLMAQVRAKGATATYRAVDEHTGEIVAVKLAVLPDGHSEHLEREFRIGSRLSHPNLIRYHDYLCLDGVSGLVTDLAEGEPFLRALPRPSIHSPLDPVRE